MFRFLKVYRLAIAAAIVVVMGFTGHLIANFGDLPDASLSTRIKVVLDSLLQSMQLFTLSNRPRPGVDNWFLVIARLGGALVAFGTIGKVLLAVFEKARQRAALGRAKGHVVLAGFGDRGRHFFANLKGRKAAVLIDTLPPVDDVDQGRLIRLQGDARDRDVLKQAGLARADALVIGTGSDERNLSIALAALEFIDDQNRKTEFELVVTIDEPLLADAIEREDRIMRPDSRRELSIHLFNPARAAALELLAQPSWLARALRSGQPCVRLAIFGATPVAIEVLMQFLRISPCAGLARPEVHLFGPDSDIRRNLLARSDNFAAVLDPAHALASNNPPPLAWAVDLRIHDAVPGQDPMTELLGMLDARQMLTAAVVAAGDSVSNIRISLRLRQALQRLGLPACPIHVYAPIRSNLDTLLATPNQDAVIAQSPIEPFGRNDSLCSVGFGERRREKLAREIHEAYRLRRHADSSRPATDSSDESLRPWPALGEKRRHANRRAADHLPVKWLSARHLAGLELEPEGFPSEWCPEWLEALAAIEHDSWRIGLELDGWRASPLRDDSRMLHTDLVPYAALPERTKDYDRQQVLELREANDAVRK